MMNKQINFSFIQIALSLKQNLFIMNNEKMISMHVHFINGGHVIYWFLCVCVFFFVVVVVVVCFNFIQ